ncbi:uncharacterized protein LOC124371822, partial [Homalodisca vitripennis]|uniref:uncharacterized protein LOC124371822 n=1 Tax=Homalodisca vitripennis TaxID=197043 RepID=UPI001EEA6051
MSKADVECVTADNLVWRCQPCASERRKSMRFESQATEGKLTIEDVMKKIIEVAESQKEMEKNFNKSYETLYSKIDESTEAVKIQTEEVEKCLAIVDGLVNENKILREKISSLEARIEEQEQYSRRNTVEIHGIPQEKNEDVVSVVKEVGKALDFNISNTMIDACHRLGKRSEPNSPPPGIVLKFVSRLDKEELLRKRRVKSNFSTRHMNLEMDKPVYINESLTPMKRKLMAEARKFKRENNYQFVWVRDGRIFLRKEETSKVIHVTCQADLPK